MMHPDMPLRWFPRIASLLFLLLSAAHVRPAAAQDEFRQRVRDIRIRHAGPVTTGDDSYVLTHVTARPGEYVSQRDLSRDQRALLDTGLFSDVRILVEPAGDDVRVIYEVWRRLRFQPPAIIKGNERLSDRKIRKYLDLGEGDLIDTAVLAQRCDRIRAEYRKSRYPHALVEAAISPREDGMAEVVILIDEGQRQRMGGFIFKGNHAVDNGTLRSALGQPRRINPFYLFYHSWRKRAFDFEVVRDTVRQIYLDKGYLDVKVRVDECYHADDESTTLLLVTIDEGPAYRVGAVQTTGVTLFPTQDIEAAAGMQVGAVASRSAIRDAERRVRDFYGRRGYVDTVVRCAAIAGGDDPAAPQVTLRFDVKEGELAYIRNIIIRGNTRTRDKVIRREIRSSLAPGMVLDEVQAERSRKVIENLNYFENVRLHEVPVRGDPALRDVIYEVEEKNTGQLMVGIGFSSDEKVMGFAEISQSNFDIANWPYFHGGGQKLRASLEMGSETRNVEISLTEPWFLNRRLSLSTELHRRERRYNEFDATRLGGGVGLTVPLAVGRLNFRYTLEKLSLDDVLEGAYVYADEPERTYRFTDEEDDYLNAPFRVTWIYDTRNRAFVPTRGTRGSIFAEVSAPWTGSDLEIYKVGAEFRHWLPLWAGHVLSLQARAESVDTYGDEELVPISDRLFLGGGRSVRGFRYRDIGPKVIPSEPGKGRYRPVGGQTLAMASLEYTIPVFKIFRLAAFYDIGGVWTEAFDADFDRLASSYGFGVRFDIPGFPIRLDYAIPIEHDDDYTRSERFVLWIGFE